MVTAKDEYRHTPSPEENWQESVVLVWYDSQHMMGGMYRIGLEPNKKKSNFWSFITQEKRIIHNNVMLDLPMSEDKDWDHITVGILTRKTLDPLKKFQFLMEDQDIKADLTFEAFHPVFDYSETLPGNVAANHFEGSGEVKGSVICQGKTYDITGIGHRDHSWGVRHWGNIDNHRWICGIFGKDFAFNAISMCMAKEDRAIHSGFVFDGNKNTGIIDAEILVELEDNGRIQRGIRMNMKDMEGRIYEVNAEAIAVCPVQHGPYICNEGLSKFRMGNRIGYGIIEYGRRAGDAI
jgi:hypothetical protein